MSPSRILLADDQDDVLEALELLLRHAGHDVTTTTSPKEVLSALAAQEFDAILMDLNYARDTTSGREGLDLLARIRDSDAMMPVVVMTAWGSVEGAVEAMRLGARDYVQKPWDNERLLQIIRTQIELGRALRRAQRLESETSRARKRELPELVAESPAMRQLVRLIDRVARSDASILITGEHGTGKDVVARCVHAASDRSGGPFVALDAGGVSDGVFESELFGHVKGAFTDAKNDRAGCLELADGGTLFLDEIGNMPVGQQAKLLRVLQTGEYHPVGSTRWRQANVRVLSATNIDIRKAIAEGRFREDLLYRLNTVPIHVPPLRDRTEDIMPLATSFAERFARRRGQAIRTFSPMAVQALRSHSWPGNVRELEHVVERGLLLAEGPSLEPNDLALQAAAPGTGALNLEQLSLEDAERYLIERALARSSGQITDAAKALGLSRSALYRRLQVYGLKGAG